MSYADLAATLLAAVGVIVAIFGGILALTALWGFNQMKQEAVRSATAAALSETKEQIENGTIRRYILEEVEARITEIVASSDFDRRVRARVDQIVLGNPDDRFLEDEGGEES
jgi:Tfp pilus assembly protein PilE